MKPERLAQLVFQSVDFATLTLALDGVITSWNAAAERTMGWSAVEAIGWHSCMLFTPQDIAAGISQFEMDNARTSGQATDERQHLRQDGSRFWGLSSMTRLEDDEIGTHIGYVKIVRTMHRPCQEKRGI